MKFTRKANAVWNGSGKKGTGSLGCESGVLKDSPYSSGSRFADEKGTNPEELIGAALAGCFAMQLAYLIGEEGHTPDKLNVASEVHFEDGSVTRIDLNLKGSVPGMDSSAFAKTALKAKEVCPISKLLNAEINLDANLED